MIAAAVCRGAAVAAALLLWGGYAFLAVLTPVGLAPALARRIAPATRAALAVALVLAPVWLLAQGAAMGGDLDGATLGTVLTETAFGRVWQAHLLGLLLLVGTRSSGGTAGRWLSAGAAGLLVANLARLGHAAAQTGPGAGWLEADHVLHLLATGAWLGALPCVLALMGALDGPDHRADAAAALRRFSTAGHAVVALVLATGTLDMAVLLARAPADVATPYRTILFVKLRLVGAMTVINRYLLVPSLALSPEESIAGLRRNTALALGLGALVLVAAGALGSTEPG